MASFLESLFPGLAPGSYTVTSPRSQRYNCIGWAAGDDANWWWPEPNPVREYWPPGVAREETVEAFQAAFAPRGYAVCGGEDLEAGFEKIALFANHRNEPKHAARQLPDGRWTSKLGHLEDIEHALRDVEGEEYGTVVLIMKRPVAKTQPKSSPS